MRGAAVISMLAIAACTPEPPARLAVDGGLPLQGANPLALEPADAGPDGGAVPGAGPAALPLLAAEAVLAEGASLPISPGAVTTVAPTARFRVELGARLTDARLSILDAQDAMVASEGVVELGTTTRLTVEPAAPLRPGGSYTLRLEGAEGRLLVGEDGRTYQPLSLALQVSGVAPAPPRRGRRTRRR